MAWCVVRQESLHATWANRECGQRHNRREEGRGERQRQDRDKTEMRGSCRQRQRHNQRREGVRDGVGCSSLDVQWVPTRFCLRKGEKFLRRIVDWHLGGVWLLLRRTSNNFEVNASVWRKGTAVFSPFLQRCSGGKGTAVCSGATAVGRRFRQRWRWRRCSGGIETAGNGSIGGGRQWSDGDGAAVVVDDG